ncbi:MAG: siphovirus Gp157 family protein [Prevotella sp.]|nr:siphovirus Gp157 family protein [Candidatus Prevotella equi]
MSNLYELTAEYRELLMMLEDSETADEVIIDTLEAVEGELEIKAEGYVKVIRSMEADAKALMEEADRLAEKAAVVKNRIEKLKLALQMALIATGHDDREGVQAGLYRIKLVNNGGQRPLIIDGEVPNRFVKMIPQNDNHAIRQHLEELATAGIECTWAHLGERGKHITIK